MKRAQRIAVEIFALVGIYMLWNFRFAATLFLILCVVEAMRQDRPEDRGVPTLRDSAASRGGLQQPDSGRY